MNTFGVQFRITVIGESHGDGVGIIIDGCPAGVALSAENLQEHITRRAPRQHGTTPRKEADTPVFLTGLFDGKTTGAPLTIYFRNKNRRSDDYDDLRHIPRPGHADETARIKYGGYNDHRGGGQHSGRLTLPLTAAGAVARKLLQSISFNAKILEIGGNSNIEVAVSAAVADNDSCGGIIRCTVSGIPAGIGEPFFNSVESRISHLVFSIPGIRGISFGSGFEGARLRGSVWNDQYTDNTGKTDTNHAGGVLGGITTGNDLVFSVAVRPPASIPASQRSFDHRTGKQTTLKTTGRHDACFARRVPVIIESVAAVVIADLMLEAQRIPRVMNK